MANSNSTLSQSDLKERLHYNPNTGVFTWKIRPGKSSIPSIGDIAGCEAKFKNGKKYIVIRIKRKMYLAHRLAWLYMFGLFPETGIDHNDGNGLNNKISNLSPATQLENSKNQRLRSTNTSGYIGIAWIKSLSKWRARIKVNYKQIHIGVFSDIEDAIKARKEAQIKYGFHKNHGTDRPL